MKRLWLLCLLLVACSNEPQSYGAGANQIGEIGQVPQTVKLAAAEVLRRCKVAAAGTAIFFQWEAPSERPGYTIELPHHLAKDKAITNCIADQITSLRLNREIDWGEKPPHRPSR